MKITDLEPVLKHKSVVSTHWLILCVPPKMGGSEEVGAVLSNPTCNISYVQPDLAVHVGRAQGSRRNGVRGVGGAEREPPLREEQTETETE